MPATPAAPAFMQAAVFSASTPPNASTGTPPAASKASLSVPRPTPSTTSSFTTHFPKTGPNRIKSTPASRARATSATVWHEIPTTARSPAPANSAFTWAHVNSAADDVKCTPSAPAASATSGRPFISSFVASPCLAKTAIIARANSTNSPAARVFSRSCTKSTPTSLQRAALLSSPARRASALSPNREPSVMAQRITSSVYLAQASCKATSCKGLMIGNGGTGRFVRLHLFLLET
jgi:hypothetical protein